MGKPWPLDNWDRERVIDLLRRVCAVSVKTMDAVERLSGLRRG